jgi:hypothetical protein
MHKRKPAFLQCNGEGFQVRVKNHAKVLLMMIPLILGLIVSSNLVDIATFSNTKSNNDNSSNQALMDNNDVLLPLANKLFSVAQMTHNGILDPVEVKHSGYQKTDAVRARTDTGTNTAQNITIDDANDWSVNYTEIEVSDLKRLYGLNGTFEDGVDPWTNYSIDGGANTQIADYNSIEEYVICKNVGDYDWKPSTKHTWTHSTGTEIGWEQVVNNTNGELDFNMKYDFRYVTGPIDPVGDNGFEGVVGAFYAVQGVAWYSGWYYPMDWYVDSRDAWYSITHDFTIPTPWSQFSIYVGLYFAADVTLNNHTNYDDDPLLLPDGTENAQNITLYIDNVEFTSIAAPSFESVDLTFNAGVYSEPITGSSIGTASISNPSFWSIDPLQIEITSNTSVAFTYSVTSLFHRYINSSWTTDLNANGVAYSVNSGQSPNLAIFTYVTPPSDYFNSTIDILYPKDWENTTIWDPLANNITDLCSLFLGRIHIPNSELGRSGWWEINLNGLNYAKNISVQVYDQSLTEWSENTLFRPTNDTRVQVEVGTPSVIPLAGAPVNISWILPNGTLWALDSITSMINGAVNSSTWTYGGTNTTAGEWSIDIIWTNGTEVAFESVSFDLYHTASIVATYPSIETDFGMTISNLVTLRDADTNEYLLDDSVSIEANWSSLVISFSQNYAKNWWEADFDTSQLNAGQFAVIVNASRPYFDDVSVQFTIIITFTTDFEILGITGDPIEVGLNENHTFVGHYALENGTAIEGGTIASGYTGPANGLDINYHDDGLGNYSISVMCLISGSYTISLTATKNYHHDGIDSFAIIVGEINSVLVVENGTSDFVRTGDSYRLVVQYLNSTGFGLIGANVSVVDVTPSTDFVYGVALDEGNGYYSILLTPSAARPFTIVVKANLTNHVTQHKTFTLTVTEIPTLLTLDLAGVTISVDQNHTVQLSFLDDLSSNLEGAKIHILNPPSSLTFGNPFNVSAGLYNVTIQPSIIGTFQIAFRATLSGYQNSTVGFTLIVESVPTELLILEDISSDSVNFLEAYSLTLAYIRTDINQNISSADILVSTTPSVGLGVVVIEVGDTYHLQFSTDEVGKWKILISANKTNYNSGFAEFELEVVLISTTVNEFSLLEALLFGRSYNLTFNYLMFNQSEIPGAEITSSGSAAQWVTIEELGAGQYRIILTPEEIGDYDVILGFSKDGFESKTSTLSFTAESVPIQIIDVQGLSATEGQQTTLSLRLVEVDTGDPVTDAIIEFQIIDDTGQGDLETLVEIEDGLYSATFTMSSADSTPSLRVYVSSENHELDVDFFETTLTPIISDAALLTRTIQQLFPFAVLLVFGIIGFAGRRSWIRKQREKNIEAMIVKRRFDDLQSLLGVLVIHKHSGIPIYSKIVKGGLDEALVSGFISAITTFRSEFDVDQEDFTVSPISDIIRAVPTENLLCAFITLTPPSKSQELKMIEFAETIGFIFDSMFTEPPSRTLEEATEVQFDTLFDDLLDGQFLKPHKVVEDKGLPRGSKCLEEKIDEVNRSGSFELQDLATKMTSCGLEEARVYKIIYDAIEKEYIIAAPLEEEAHDEYKSEEI